MQHHMKFAEALGALEDQRAVCRSAWKNIRFVVLMPVLYLPPYNTQDTNRKVNDRTARWIGVQAPLDCQPYFAVYTSDNLWQPGWQPTAADLLADDWFLVEPQPA